jgi:hypothetical protein
VSAVAWQTHVVVLNNILLDNGLSCFVAKCLFNSLIINVSSRKESNIAWNVSSRLGSPNTKYLIGIKALTLIHEIDSPAWWQQG